MTKQQKPDYEKHNGEDRNVLVRAIQVAEKEHPIATINKLYDELGDYKNLQVVLMNHKDKIKEIVEYSMLKADAKEKIILTRILERLKLDANTQAVQEDNTKKQLEECTKHRDETTALLQRMQADFENYKKRSHKDYENITKNACRNLIANLLPILDSFQIALKNTNNQENFIKGIELIYCQLYSALEAQGLRRIDALGKKFDPYKHEVLLQEKSDKEEEIVLEELQTGYMLGDTVLRFTKVKVATK